MSPALDDFCPPFPTVPTTPTVLFPSGIELAGSVSPNDYPTPLGLAASLLDQAGPVMGGLNPFFKVLDVLIALFESIKAIPDSILQLNPEPIISSLVALTEAVAEVIKLIPQLSVPIMIVNLIDLVILALQGISGELTAIGAMQAQADKLRSGASVFVGNSELLAQCVERDAQAQVDALNASLGPIGKIIEIMNLMTSLAGLPEIPGIGSFTNAADGATLLNDFISTITDIRNAIPI